MVSGIKIVIMISVLVVMASCYSEKFEDVNSDPKFKNFVEAKYKIINQVYAYGMRAHSAAEVDYMTLIPPPGIKGSQVAFRFSVEIGARITIKKVLKSNRLFDRNITFIVVLEGIQLPKNVPIRMDLFRGNEDADIDDLNRNIYERQI